MLGGSLPVFFADVYGLINLKQDDFKNARR